MNNQNTRYRFNEFILDPYEGTLRKDDVVIPLHNKTFDVLQYLVSNAGRVITKDELLKSVWNDRFVGESNLYAHVSRARKALGHSQQRPVIRTVHTIGFRFVARVESSTP